MMNNKDFELEDMRQQMATLNKKLAQQEIVNDRMIRHSMKKRVDTILRKYHAIIAVGLLMVFYSYWSFVKISNFSIIFWIATCILMLACSGATYYNSKNLTDNNLMTNNLVDVRRRMARAKKFDANWLFIGIPSVIIWFGFFVYETYKIHSNVLDSPLFWGGCFGGIVGAIVGFNMHFNIQRQYQDIIDQIEDITAGQ
ncbi:MAG: hypothetical protein K2O48_00340 [Prevotella sp.]|nr:hypothetical protein [Prevotella sp.]